MVRRNEPTSKRAGFQGIGARRYQPEVTSQQLDRVLPRTRHSCVGAVDCCAGLHSLELSYPVDGTVAPKASHPRPSRNTDSVHSGCTLAMMRAVAPGRRPSLLARRSPAHVGRRGLRTAHEAWSRAVVASVTSWRVATESTPVSTSLPVVTGRRSSSIRGATGCGPEPEAALGLPAGG